jgi:hypothetical protein
MLNGGGSDIQYIVRTFVDATMYSHPAQWFKKIYVLDKTEKKTNLEN